MMKNDKGISFLKVLTTVAWADGEVTESELNVLKSFYQKFNLSSDQINQLKPYLEAPVSREEQEQLHRQLIAKLNSSREKLDLLKALESVANADHVFSKEEKVLVDQFSNWLAQSSFTEKSFGIIRGYFASTIFKPAREKNPAIVKYFQAKVFRIIEIKSGKALDEFSVSEDRIYILCLLGSLLALVANVDERIEESEKTALKNILKEQFSMQDEELSILCDVVEEQAQKGFDFHEVVTEYNSLVTYNDRVQLSSCFFAVASADGELTHDETEEIRRITKALRIPHKTFIDSKVESIGKLRPKKDE